MHPTHTNGQLLNLPLDFKPVDLIENKNGVPKTTTKKVAEVFGKQHKDVLRAVDSLGCSADFNQRNFAPIYYLDDQNRHQRMYEMTRDGFTMLVMGFTGKKADTWKELYIGAFSAMERKLRDAELETMLPATAMAPVTRLLHARTFEDLRYAMDQIDKLLEHLAKQKQALLEALASKTAQNKN